MSPFSQVEMSPFVVLKKELQHKGEIESGDTSDERTGVDAIGGRARSQAEEIETT